MYLYIFTLVILWSVGVTTPYNGGNAHEESLAMAKLYKAMDTYYRAYLLNNRLGLAVKGNNVLEHEFFKGRTIESAQLQPKRQYPQMEYPYFSVTDELLLGESEGSMVANDEKYFIDGIKFSSQINSEVNTYRNIEKNQDTQISDLYYDVVEGTEDLSTPIPSMDEMHNSFINSSSLKQLISSFEDLEETIDWLSEVKSLSRRNLSKNTVLYHKEWVNVLPLLSNTDTVAFHTTEAPLVSLKSSIMTMYLTNAFIKAFWPFNYEISRMNQQLALAGFHNSFAIQFENPKLDFFHELSPFQSIDIPAVEDRIVYSFDNPTLVDGMNRSGLVLFSRKYVTERKHIFDVQEREVIVPKVNKALKLIHKVSPDLYNGIVQLVGCFAFYKSEEPGELAGTSTSALGIVWLNPDAGEEWSVEKYADHIVHEFIHTSLFYAELVHGLYNNHEKLLSAEVMSAIKKVPRGFDKSLHAAYVATGLVVFHARAGLLEQALTYAENLRASVDLLQIANKEHDVLTDSGRSMLQSMMDLLKMTRMEKGKL